MKTLRSFTTVVMLFGLIALFSQQVYAATGVIIWINPPDKLGKIIEDGTGEIRLVHDPLSDLLPNFKAGDRVTYELDCKSSRYCEVELPTLRSISDSGECGEDEELVDGECV